MNEIFTAQSTGDIFQSLANIDDDNEVEDALIRNP